MKNVKIFEKKILAIGPGPSGPSLLRPCFAKVCTRRVFLSRDALSSRYCHDVRSFVCLSVWDGRAL